jgi:hypothetical protein
MSQGKKHKKNFILLLISLTLAVFSFSSYATVDEETALGSVVESMSSDDLLELLLESQSSSAPSSFGNSASGLGVGSIGGSGTLRVSLPTYTYFYETEPNNTPATANLPPLPSTSQGTLPVADIDVYKVSVPAGGTLVSQIIFGSDCLALLLDANASAIGSVAGGSYVSTITFSPTTAGPYYVVLGNLGSGTSPYTLNLSYTNPLPTYEPNDTQAVAHDLGTVTNTAAVYTNLSNATDVDWYRFTTTDANRFATVVLSCNSSISDAQLKVQMKDASGNQINSFVNANKERIVNLPCLSPGTYYIKVSANTTGDALTYYFTLTTATASFTLDVPLVGQEKSNWCWVATAKMAGEAYWKPLNNYTSPARSVTQSQISQAVRGNTYNSAGSVSDSIRAISYVLEDDPDSDAATWSDPFAISSVAQSLAQMKPIKFSIHHPSQSIGHALVIKGISFSGSSTYLAINDPWPVGQGSLAEVEYSALLNVGYSASDIRVWSGTFPIVRNLQ